jgi:hypothetical protein
MGNARPNPLLLLLPIILYLLSFIMPIRFTPGRFPDGWGMGSMGFLYGLSAWRELFATLSLGFLLEPWRDIFHKERDLVSLALSWLANPLFWIGLCLTRRGRYTFAMSLGLAASGLGLMLVATPFMRTVALTFPAWWVWQAAMIMLVFSAMLEPPSGRHPDRELSVPVKCALVVFIASVIVLAPIIATVIKAFSSPLHSLPGQARHVPSQPG